MIQDPVIELSFFTPGAQAIRLHEARWKRPGPLPVFPGTENARQGASGMKNTSLF